MGIREFIGGYVRNVKSHFSAKQGVLATHLCDWASCELTARPDCQFLSCSAPAVVTLQLPTCFACVAFWQVASRKSLARSSIENPLNAHLNSSHSSHTQPLHYSHLNTRYLIAKIQANLTRNKANTWLNKFNLTILNCVINEIEFRIIFCNYIYLCIAQNLWNHI